MEDMLEVPPIDDSLRASFIACDHLEKSIIDLLAFCSAAHDHGPAEWHDAADRACSDAGFAALFVGVLKRALTDLRLALPEAEK